MTLDQHIAELRAELTGGILSRSERAQIRSRAKRRLQSGPVAPSSACRSPDRITTDLDYEPPSELSGRGGVLGAIAEDADDSAIRLRLDFSLSKRRGRSTPSTDEPPDAARTDGSKLSLRALLHYLWEEAELNCWSRGMVGKRNWAVVRHRLAMAVAHKLVKGVPLARKLFIPETFAADRKAEIADRRRVELAALVADGRTQPLMLLVGEVKEIGQARFGVKLVIKHLPRKAAHAERRRPPTTEEPLRGRTRSRRYRRRSTPDCGGHVWPGRRRHSFD